jgi:hypothetical protein
MMRAGRLMLAVLLPFLSLPVGPAQPQAPPPQYPHSPILVPNPSPGSLDQNAIALLKSVERKYAALETFSCEVDTGNIGEDHKPTIVGRGLMRFNRPDKLVLQRGSGSVRETARVFGNNYYVSLPGTPDEFTPIPYTSTPNSIEDSPAPVKPRPGFRYIENLLLGHGFMDTEQWAAVASIRKSRQKLMDGTQVMTISVTLGYDQPHASDTTRFSIGLKDHLIHAIEQSWSATPDYTQYEAIQANSAMSDSEFELPRGARMLPLCKVTSVNELNVMLDKGRKDGVAAGDRLLVYRLPGYYPTADIEVTSVEANSCNATVRNESAGVTPGEMCIIYSHRQRAEPGVSGNGQGTRKGHHATANSVSLRLAGW